MVSVEHDRASSSREDLVLMQSLLVVLDWESTCRADRLSVKMPIEAACIGSVLINLLASMMATNSAW